MGAARVLLLLGLFAVNVHSVPIFAPPPVEKDHLGLLGTCPDGTVEEVFYENDFNDIFKNEYEERSHPKNVVVEKGALSVNGSDGTDSVLWRINVPHEAVGDSVHSFCVGMKKKAYWGRVGFEMLLADADGQLLSVGYAAKRTVFSDALRPPPPRSVPPRFVAKDGLPNACWRENAGRTFLQKSDGNCSAASVQCCQAHLTATVPPGLWLQDVLCYAPHTGAAWLERNPAGLSAAPSNERVAVETRTSARRGLHLRLQWKEGRGMATMWGRQHLLVDNLQVHTCKKKVDLRQMVLKHLSGAGVNSTSVVSLSPFGEDPSWPLWHTHLGQVLTPGVFALVPMTLFLFLLLILRRRAGGGSPEEDGINDGPSLLLYARVDRTNSTSSGTSTNPTSPVILVDAREPAATYPATELGGAWKERLPRGHSLLELDTMNPLFEDASRKVDVATGTSPRPSAEQVVRGTDLEKGKPRRTKLSLAEEISLQLAEDEEEQSWRIHSMDEVELLGKLDEGEFGEVFRGRWKGAEVAVKRIKPRGWMPPSNKTGQKERAPKFHFPFDTEGGSLNSAPGSEDVSSLEGSSAHSSADSSESGVDKATSTLAETFAREVSVLRRLRSNRIVMFMGACLGPADLCLVTEYMPRGSLYDLLHRRKRQVKGRRLLTMARDIAEGCAFLHAQRIVHRDLKSSNLLLDEHYRVKVADFGLSRIRSVSNDALPTNGWAGTAAYMAPEILKGTHGAYTERADCYSFGVVLWEMVMREVPWKDLEPWEIIARVAYSTDVLRTPEEGACPPGFAQLMQRCLQSDPTARPRFTDVLQLMDDLLMENDKAQRSVITSLQ